LSVKKLMILAVMLAMGGVAAIPALAQDTQQDAGNASGDSGGTVVAGATPSDGGSEDNNLSYNANPAPADGSSEIIVAGPAGDSTSGSSSEIPAPAPTGGSDSSGCSNADKIALRSAPADNGGDDSGSVTAASAPGCSYVVIEE
jgi:hypothetical protein